MPRGAVVLVVAHPSAGHTPGPGQSRPLSLDEWVCLSARAQGGPGKERDTGSHAPSPLPTRPEAGNRGRQGKCGQDTGLS